MRPRKPIAPSTPRVSLSLREAADRIGCGGRIIERACATGELSSFTIGRRRFIRVEALESYIARRERLAQEGAA